MNAAIAEELESLPSITPIEVAPWLRWSHAPTPAPLRYLTRVAHPEVLCLSADLTSSCEIDGFRDRHPEQFLSLGMAEQNMMSFAGGLGLAGFRPFLHTFGVFLYRRPYDQFDGLGRLSAPKSAADGNSCPASRRPAA